VPLPAQITGNTSKIVMKLLEAYLGSNRVVTMDNYYTDILLFLTLYGRGMFAIGTLRLGRRGFPSLIQDWIAKKKKKKGESIVVRSEKWPEVLVAAWQDTKAVNVMSTFATGAQQGTCKRRESSVAANGAKTYSRERKDVPVPQIVLDYQQDMGGVDRADQDMSIYRAMTTTRKQWWRNLFWGFMVMACVHNAFVTFNMTRHRAEDKLTRMAFQERLADELMGDFNGRKTVGRPMGAGGKKRAGPHDAAGDNGDADAEEEPVEPPPAVRHKVHHLVKLGHDARRRCSYCSKPTTYRCESCDVTVCMTDDLTCMNTHLAQ
jgi:hypothetical protein